MSRSAVTDHPIHEHLANRWSPVGFDNRMVPKEELRSLFEAVRWAPSSYNEQPWRYLVAAKEDTNEFHRMLECLVDANQTWAKHAPVLALGVVSLNFTRNGKPNRAAHHDLGLASGNLCVEATARGLYVHQMIGIHPDVARETYAIPRDFEVLTALAIGNRAEPESLPEVLRERDARPRERKPLRELVFSRGWGDASPFLD